jgi:quercetin dioxygenase-like cupin family protein
MIIRTKDMRSEVRGQMKGGVGDVTVKHLVECESLANIRFVGEMTLPQGAGIGMHTHDKETEYYIITEGIGYVDEGDGTEIKVTKGDVIVTGDGSTHCIRNGGHTDLIVTAFIVTE